MHTIRVPRTVRERRLQKEAPTSTDSVSSQIIDTILADNADSLGEILATLDDINDKLKLTNFTLPPILSNNPPYSALAAFFRSPSCFELFVMMSFDDKATDSMNRSLDHFAAAGGDLAIIRELERLGHSFSEPDVEGNSPLHYACQMGKLDVVQWLWMKGVTLTDRSHRGETALSVACLMGHLDIVKFLLDKAGVPMAPEDRRSYWMRRLDTQALHAACRGGHSAIASYLIEKGSPVNELDSASETPLNIAASSGSLGCVRLLIALPGLVRNTQHRKHSPVVDASAFGHLDVVRCLVGAGFSATLPNSRGVTPLECAIKNGHLRITRFLVEHGALIRTAVGSAIQAACAVSSLETVTLLVEQGEVDVAGHPKAREWLQQAIELEARDIIDFLLARGVSLKESSMANVIRRRNEEFTAWLIERGAEITGGKGEPPIVAAIRAGDFAQINRMMERGAVLSAAVIESHPECIEAAVKRHDCKLLKFLLDYKPDFAKNPERISSYLSAAVRDYFHARRLAPEKRKTVYGKVIEMLLAAGVAIEEHRDPLQGGFGYRVDPVTIAMNNGSVELLELFERYGFDFSTMTYSLTELKYGVGIDEVRSMFEFLDTRGARQSPNQSDGDLGVGRAISAGISEELLDFLLTRVKSTRTNHTGWVYQSGLDICAAQHNEQFAIKLIEFGFTAPSSFSFQQWIKQTTNQRLKELANASKSAA